MAEQRKIVGVFGSAGTEPGTPAYLEGLTLGAALAKAGYAIMTGGYGGMMGAASEGAAGAGGTVIGVTVGLFRERGLVPNPFLHEEIHLPSLAERLNYLVVKPDAYVTMDGGVGTLSELALVWSLLQVGEIPARPMILVGKMWQEFVPHFARISTIGPNDTKWLVMVNRAAEVVPALAAWWASPPNLALRIGDIQPLLGDPPREP